MIINYLNPKEIKNESNNDTSFKNIETGSTQEVDQKRMKKQI